MKVKEKKVSCTSPDRITVAMQTLEAGVKKLVESGEWERWLRFQAVFHRYSYSNTLLILEQNPEAMRVAGFRTWEKLGRMVKKGEKAIWILAPRFYKSKGDKTIDDEGTDQERDASTDAEKRIRVGFRAVPVFDLSQTEGEDLPSPVRKLTGDDDGGLFDRLKAYSEGRGCPVAIGDVRGSANGSYSPDEHRISIAEGLAPSQMAKTLAHEIAHSHLHSEIGEYVAHREDAELEAESVAFVVLHHAGLDSGQYSFGYLTSWQGGDEQAIKALKESSARIQKTAQMIIDAIEESEPGDGKEEAKG